MVTLWCFLGTFNRKPVGGKRLGSVARALAKQPMLEASRVWHAYFLLFSFYFLKPFLYHLKLCFNAASSQGSQKPLLVARWRVGWWVLQRWRNWKQMST